MYRFEGDDTVVLVTIFIIALTLQERFCKRVGSAIHQKTTIALSVPTWLLPIGVEVQLVMRTLDRTSLPKNVEVLTW